MNGIRCTDCMHFTGRGEVCTTSSKHQHQSAAWRNCSAFYPADDNQAIINTAALPEWIYDLSARAQSWSVASMTDDGSIEFYRMVFPAPVTTQAACDEAGRHWRKFRIKAGRGDSPKQSLQV